MCIYGTGAGGQEEEEEREVRTEAELTTGTKPTRICSRPARSIGQSIKGKDDESRDSHQL